IEPEPARPAHRLAQRVFRRWHRSWRARRGRGGDPVVRVAGRARRADRAAEHEARRAGVLRHRSRRGVLEPFALRRRALRLPREGVRRSNRHVLPHARRGLRRRGEAQDPCRHLRAVARLLRRLLPAGAEDQAPDRARLRRGVRALRRDHGADLAGHRVRARHEKRRPGADVPGRYLHRSRAARRAAGPLGAVRLRRQGIARGAAADGGLLLRGAAARHRAPLSAGERLAPASTEGNAVMKYAWIVLFSLSASVSGKEAYETRELVGQVGSRSALMVVHATRRADGGWQLTGEYVLLPTLMRRFVEGERSPELGVTTLKEGNTAILYGRPASGELRGASGRCRVTLREVGEFVRVAAENCAAQCGSEAYLEPLIVDRRGHCQLLREEPK